VGYGGWGRERPYQRGMQGSCLPCKGRWVRAYARSRWGFARFTKVVHYRTRTPPSRGTSPRATSPYRGGENTRTNVGCKNLASPVRGGGFERMREAGGVLLDLRTGSLSEPNPSVTGDKLPRHLPLQGRREPPPRRWYRVQRGAPGSSRPTPPAMTLSIIQRRRDEGIPPYERKHVLKPSPPLGGEGGTSVCE
jgi:hypothetical protein